MCYSANSEGEIYYLLNSKREGEKKKEEEEEEDDDDDDDDGEMKRRSRKYTTKVLTPSMHFYYCLWVLLSVLLNLLQCPYFSFYQKIYMYMTTYTCI